jgi:hypothetical protein
VIDKVPLLAGGLDCLGVNVTLMVQFAPAATLVPQVFVSENSLESVVMLMPLPANVSVPVPELVNVTTCGVPDWPTTAVGNVKLVGERVTAGLPAPVPVKLTACGLVGALSVMLTEEVRVPVAAGVKVTLIVHFAPAATEVMQVFAEIAKSAGLVPVRLTPVMVRGWVPTFVSVTDWDGLATPTV